MGMHFLGGVISPNKRSKYVTVTLGTDPNQIKEFLPTT